MLHKIAPVGTDAIGVTMCSALWFFNGNVGDLDRIVYCGEYVTRAGQGQPQYGLEILN